MSKARDKWLGNTYSTLNGAEYEVIDYIDSNNVTIRFLDTGTTLKVSTGRIRSGIIKDRAVKTIFGVACMGVGIYNPVDHLYPYHVWHAMLERCYHRKSPTPTYEGCTASEEWLNFQNFAPFYFDDLYRQDGWHLDKDLLFSGNKVYSAETCVFLPLEINVLLAVKKKSNEYNLPQGVMIGETDWYESRIMLAGKVHYLGTFYTVADAYAAYRVKKESYVRAQADKWDGLIDPRAVEALRVWSLP
jgi:hypothetical protein